MQQSVAIGNTSYAGRYVFGGTKSSATPPVQQQGNPIAGVTFLGNQQEQGQLVYNGQEFPLSTTRTFSGRKEKRTGPSGSSTVQAKDEPCATPPRTSAFKRLV